MSRILPSRNFPPCPPSLKQIQHYLKTATEHDDRDVVIAYWCRLYALQLALKIDRSSSEAKKLLGHLMDWLEKTKAEQVDNEAICHDIPAQAHLENYALRLFVWADSQDRAGSFNKNVVKAFYTAGIIYDVLDTFGEPSEEVQQNKKYAKWKAAYIHNCLKNGEMPVPGPVGDNEEEEASSSNQPPQIRVRPSQLRSFSERFSLHQEPEDTSPGHVSKKTSVDPQDQIPTARSVSGSVGANSAVQLSPEQMNKAQKYCKFAASALTYEDVPTAVTNLQKALQLLTTGEED